jgi:hypothetical protein
VTARPGDPLILAQDPAHYTVPERTGSLRLGTRPIVVFSHPNHEIAVLGMIHEMDCPIIYLTDGGSASRRASSREALSRIGHRENVLFLNRTEPECYQALLDGDRSAVLRKLVEELAGHLEAFRPDSLLTEPMEFYNPLHDFTLPIVSKAAALAAVTVSVHEAPLIYQCPEDSSYRINRFPPSTRSVLVHRVPDALLEAKFSLYHGVYHDLRSQLETLNCCMSREWFAQEYYRPASEVLGVPDGSRILRYDQRGKLLQKAGSVGEAITYQSHFLPTITRLLSED